MTAREGGDCRAGTRWSRLQLDHLSPEIHSRIIDAVCDVYVRATASGSDGLVIGLRLFDQVIDREQQPTDSPSADRRRSLRSRELRSEADRRFSVSAVFATHASDVRRTRFHGARDRPDVSWKRALVAVGG